MSATPEGKLLDALVSEVNPVLTDAGVGGLASAGIGQALRRGVRRGLADIAAQRPGASTTPLADKLCGAKDALAQVLAEYPEQAYGSAWLEEAIERVGRCESEVEPVEEAREHEAFEQVRQEGGQ